MSARNDKRFRIEILEPRILLSADALIDVVSPCSQENLDPDALSSPDGFAASDGILPGRSEAIDPVFLEEDAADDRGSGGTIDASLLEPESVLDRMAGDGNSIEVITDDGGGEMAADDGSDPAPIVTENLKSTGAAGEYREDSEASASNVSGDLALFAAGRAADQTGRISCGNSLVEGDPNAEEMTETLRAANGPPGGEENVSSPDGRHIHLGPGNTELIDGELVLEEGELLTGTGFVASLVNSGGTLNAGNSPGIMNVGAFSQGPGGTTIIEIGGTTPGNSSSDHDQWNVTGLAELDGTIELQLFGGFVPAVGNMFTIFTWGSRTGEFANWLGTTDIPGFPELAFEPTYNANDLTLEIISTPAISGAAEAAIQDGLDQLNQLGADLDSLGQFAETLPLVGDSLGNLVDMGQAITQVIHDQLTALLATLPRQSEITTEIESWDGTVVGGFMITVNGVIGNYGPNFSWDVDLEISQLHANMLLTDVASGILGAVFDPAPTVDVVATLEFDFSFGHDSDFFVAIEDLTARATIDVANIGGFALPLPEIDFHDLPGGAILDISLTDGSISLDASVTATPDDGVLTGGKITLTTLTDIGGSIAVADAFNLTEQGVLDASFTLATNLSSGFGIMDFTGTQVVVIHSDNIFDDGNEPDYTIELNGTTLDVSVPGAANATLQGDFVFKKNATETILAGSNITVEMEAGPSGSGIKIIEAGSGTGKFLLIDDDIAGTASLTIVAGPDLPNIDISGTTLNLSLNTSDDAVASIDGDTVNLPAGDYFRLAGNAVVTITTPDATLTGDFVFEQKDTADADTKDEVVVGVANLSFDFDDGFSTVVSVTNGVGAFVITDAGVVGTATADLMAGVAGIELESDVTIFLNDTNMPFMSIGVDVNGTTVVIPEFTDPGPYMRLEAGTASEPAELEILGIDLSGIFIIEQKQTITGGEDVVTIGFTDVAFPLGSLTADLVEMTNGAGAFIITSDGIAGVGSVNVAIADAFPELGLTGSFSLAINDTESAVNEMVDVVGTTETINVPAGPFLQVNGTGVTLTAGPFSLMGDFSIEQRETIDEDQLVTIMASNVQFDFGTSMLNLTNGEALFLFTDAGVAGEGSIDVDVNLFAGSFSETFEWAFNNTGVPIDEMVDWEGDLKHIDLPEGPFNRLATGSPKTFDIDIGGNMQTITAELVLELHDADSEGPERVEAGVSSFSTTLGGGAVNLSVNNGTGAFVFLDSGSAGKVTADSVVLNGASALSLTAEALAFEFNNTGLTITEGGDLEPITVSISDDTDDDVEINYGAGFESFFSVAGSAELEITGLADLTGDFVIQISDNDSNDLKVGIANLALDLKAGSFTVLSVHDGTGAFVIKSTGFAGEADMDFDVGVFGLTGTVSLLVNTTGGAVNETIITPVSTKVLSYTTAPEFDFLHICITNAAVQLGSSTVSISDLTAGAFTGLTIEINTGTGEVDVFKKGGTLLFSVDDLGNFIPGDFDPSSLFNFGKVEPNELLGMLRQLLNWMQLFRDSDVFDVTVPFTEDTTLGDVFDFAEAFLDQVYAFMTTIEIQGTTDLSGGGTIPVGASLSLKIGGFTYSNIVLTDDGAFASLNDLVTKVNNAIASYAGEPLGAPQLHTVVQARVNSVGANQYADTDPDTPGIQSALDVFAIALTPAAIADDLLLQLVDSNADFASLGFEEGDGNTSTVETTAVETQKYDQADFVTELGNRLQTLFTVLFPTITPPDMPAYNDATRVYRFPMAFGYSPTIDPLNFDFGGALGPLSGTLSGEIDVDVSLTVNLTIGFDLQAREVPRVISSSLIPVPANGQISEDGQFQVLLNGDPNDVLAPWITIDLFAANTTTNTSINDLADDINAAFVGKFYNGTPLEELLIAQKAGTGLAISVLHEPDADGDSILDPKEDLNGDLVRQENLGEINVISVRAAAADVIAAELGFGVEIIDVGGTTYYRTNAKSQILGLFVEDASFTGSLSLETTDQIDGEVKLGFLGIELDDEGMPPISDPDGKLNIIGTFNPYGSESVTASGGTVSTAAAVTLNLDGDNNGLEIMASDDGTASGDGTAFNGMLIRMVESPAITDGSAIVRYDATENILTIKVNRGVTTANAVIAAFLDPDPAFVDLDNFSVTLTTNDPAGNTGNGTYSDLDLYDPANATPAPIEVTVRLVDAESGSTRFYLSELLNGLEIANIDDMIDGPNVTGSLFATLGDISANIGPVNLPTGAEITLWVPQITKLNFNPDPYSTNPNDEGIFITFPELGAFGSFQKISFIDIIKAIDTVADSLSGLSAFSFLDDKLPFIDVSVNDLIDYASKFADVVDAVFGGGSTDTIQDMLAEFEMQIEQLFDIDPGNFSATLDDSGISTDPVITAGTATYDPDGDNNGLTFTGPEGAAINVIGSHTILNSSAIVTWDAMANILTIEMNGGFTTAQDIIDAVTAASIPWTAALTVDDDPSPGNQNDGTGTYSTAALKFSFTYMAGVADTLPFQLDLAKLVDELVGTSSGAIADFLELVTSFIQIEGSGVLNLSANATLTFDFGLDLTNPCEVHPFLYDTTGVVLTATVLGTEIEFEAALGGLYGIFIKEGTVTLDRDGNPQTAEDRDGAGPDVEDDGAEFHLGLKDTNGDGRIYFLRENLFNTDNIDLRLIGGVTAILPVYGPTPDEPLGGNADENGDGFPDNYLVIDIPDLQLLFTNKAPADNGVAEVRIPGRDNDISVSSTISDDFDVVIVEGGGAAANFAGNTLMITVDSDTTTANQILSVINPLAGGVVNFEATLIKSDSSDYDPDDSGTHNDGMGTTTTSSILLITPDFGALFAEFDLCDFIDQNFGRLLEGLDSVLGAIQGGLESVASTKLPLIGKGFGSAANFIDNFRSGLLADLQTAIDEAGGSASTAIENALKKGFWNLLGAPGLNILVDPDTGDAFDPSLGFSQLDVTVDCETGLDVNLRLMSSLDLVDTTEDPIDFDIGVPGFGLEVDGNVVVSIGFDLMFGFGLNKEDGFYFDSSAPATDPELQLFFLVEIPGLTATGRLAFLQLEVMDADDGDPSSFVGRFVVDIVDPNNDGKLTFAEITSSGTSFSDMVQADLEAIADVDLALGAGFGGGTAFPRVVATFHLDWSWSVSDGASSPQISFSGVGLDLGTLISEFLDPVLSKIREITEPFQPIIDIATARLPVFSDLAGRTVTFLDLAEFFGYLEPSTKKFIENVIGIIELINSLEGLGTGTIIIPFGSFSLLAGDSGEMDKIESLGGLEDLDVGQAINDAANTDASSTYKNKVSGFQGDLNSLDNFSIPILQDPFELFNLFIGEPVRLVEWRMPTFKFEFEWLQKIAIYPPLYAQIGGRLGATIDIGFGYDTKGITDFIASEDKNPLLLFDGFHVLDFDENGNERPELQLRGEIFAGASIDLLIVEAGVRGGIFATIDFDLNDINDDGRVRPSELISLAQLDPRCIFNIHGEIGLFLEAFLIVDLFIFKIDKTWRFAEIVLFSFDITCPEPVLASKDGAGVLSLHIGNSTTEKNASDREEYNTSDGSETIKVSHVSGDGSSETVEVQFGDWTFEFEGVTKILVGNAGAGDDIIDLRGVLVPSEIMSAGPGNDIIYLSEGPGSTASGGDGNDTIYANAAETATNVTLNGDGGNDLLVAGTKAITINGGGGADTIIGSPDAAMGDILNGGDGNDIITGDLGDDMIDGGAGNDDIEGGVGDDTIAGGPGADNIRGSRGDDTIDGGEGGDLILGGVGNDVLEGGLGDDQIFGHGGIDLIVGDVFDNGSSSTTADLANVLTGGGISIISITGEEGKGNDFLVGGGGFDILLGGEGDDFLYGGNFFVNGETQVIEEDEADFFDGGPGNDEIFGDDAHGKAGERNTGIAIKAQIFYDIDLDNLRGPNEEGFGGIEVSLIHHSTGNILETVETEADGTFEFVGLDPNRYRLKFELPAGLNFVTANAGGAASNVDSAVDGDVIGGFETDYFDLGTSTTLTSVTAGYQGTPDVDVADISVVEGNNGTKQAVFTISLSGPAAGGLELRYLTVDDTATASSGDYEAQDGIIRFEEGELVKVMQVPIFGDTTWEKLFAGTTEEKFKIEFRDPDDNSLVTSAEATIINDDPVPQISISDYIQVGDDDDDNPLTPPVFIESGVATFIVSLSNPSSETIFVDFRTEAAFTPFGLLPEDAANPIGSADFTPVPMLTLEFEPGETNQKIEIAITSDTVDEAEEQFFVRLFNPVFARIADDVGVGIIPDDDLEASVSIRPANPVHPVNDPFTTQQVEGSGSKVLVDFIVELFDPNNPGVLKATEQTVTVTWGTSPGTALPTVPTLVRDYVPFPAANVGDNVVTDLVFAPGETSKIITVEIESDLVNELDEMFFVNLLGAEKAVIAQNPYDGGLPKESNHVTIEILDDDPVGPPVDFGAFSVRFSDSMYMVTEPDIGMVNAEITLIRTAGTSSGIAILTVENGTATGGADYGGVTFPPNRILVVFGAGEFEKVINIPVFSDNEAEATETVLLSLRTPTGSPTNVTPNEAVLKIKDEDIASIVLSGLVGITEGSGGGSHTETYTIDLVGVGNVPPGVTVDYEVIQLTALDGIDYFPDNPVAASGTLALTNLTQNFTVNIVQDDIPELEERFLIRLSNPVGASLNPADSVLLGVIPDDDLTPVGGRIFYDANGNGVLDSNEKGIKDIDVDVTYYNGGVAVTVPATTNGLGDYSAMVLLGQLNISVDPDSLLSPHQDAVLFPGFEWSGEYENTTRNEQQSTEFDGVQGISPFTLVGYDILMTFASPTETSGAGRGGTDDTIFGGPGDDDINGGGGDDHIIGGHWMTATDKNVPVNKQDYDAVITATIDPGNPDNGDPTSPPLHNVFDNGPIFSVDISGLNLSGVISGQIWEDSGVVNDMQDGGELFTQEVLVHLLDGNGSPVNTVVTTNGNYIFDNIYIDAIDVSTYIVEFDVPDGFDFVSAGVGGVQVDSDVIFGNRTDKISIGGGMPATATHVDAGIRPDGLLPDVVPGGYEFTKSTYSVAEGGEVEITVVRGSSFDPAAIIFSLDDGTATAPANYTDGQGVLFFAAGQISASFTIQTHDSGLGICQFLDFTVTLREPTGRPISESTVYIYDDESLPITDDDNIKGGDNWDVILGDSAVIPANSTPEVPGAIETYGGPGKDIIDAGLGFDYVNAQLDDDIIYGREGIDLVFAGLGNDIIFAELDNDIIDGEHGRDTIVSLRDVPTIELNSTLGKLIHYNAAGSPLSEFSIANIEVARLMGGFTDNTFDITQWLGSAFISGDFGNDTLNVTADTNLKVLDVNLPFPFDEIFEDVNGYVKDAAVTLVTGETYHLGSIENVSLTGGPSSNIFDASGYSKPVTLEGLGGDDVLTGGSAGDTFVFEDTTALGTDIVFGKGGADLLDFSKVTLNDVTIKLWLVGPQTVIPGILDLIITDLIENVTGGEGDDTIDGNAIANVLIGGPGTNLLRGLGGNEIYRFDTDVALGTQIIQENPGDGNDTIDFSGTTTMAINFNGSITTAQVVNANLTLTVQSTSGNEGEFENIIGGPLDDVLRGNKYDNFIFGLAGNDVLDGKSGDDFLAGGIGNDDLDGSAGGNDRIAEIEDTNFVLTDSSLSRATGEVDTLDNIEIAILGGGRSANIFNITGWTGNGSLNGNDGATPRLDTVIAAADFDMTLSDAMLEIFRTTTTTFLLADINQAILSGGVSNNTIDASAFSGDTTQFGGEGLDILIGGFGPDILIGGLGADTLTGNNDSDILVGGPGTDLLVESRASNITSATFTLADEALTIEGLDGLGNPYIESDLLFGIETATLTGTPLSDLFDVSDWNAGVLTINGGPGVGIDTIRVDGADDPGNPNDTITVTDTLISFNGSGAINLNAIERATLAGGAGDDDLDASGFTGDATLLGGPGDDTLRGGMGDDTLFGDGLFGTGNDTFVFLEDGVADNDLVRGGGGIDTLDFSFFISAVVVNLGNPAPQVVLVGEFTLDLVAEDMEILIGGAGADFLIGNSLNNTFTGGGGAEVLIDGAGGTNTIRETADADFILTDGSLIIAAIVDTLANIQNANLTGGPGINNIDASAFSGTAAIDPLGGDDAVTGSAGGTLFIAGPGIDTIMGLGGDDIYSFDVDNPLDQENISDLGGADTFSFLPTESESVSVDLSLTGVLQTVHVTNLDLTITVGTVIESLFGGAQADTLTGNGADNIIFGGGGNDMIDGGGGTTNTVFVVRDADIKLENGQVTIDEDANPMTANEIDTLANINAAVLAGGAGNNRLDASLFTLGDVTLAGLAGNDILFGGAGNDILGGGAGHDVLFGNAGNDTIDGDAGKDTLIGGEGNDDLRGGDDSDTYLFDLSFGEGTLDNLGTDTITETGGGGANDVILGVGLSGVGIDLGVPAEGLLQMFNVFDPILGISVLRVTLVIAFGSGNNIEDAF